MAKLPLTPNPDTAYFLLPCLVEAKEIEEDTTFETEHGEVAVPAGSYLVSIGGEPRSVVSKKEFHEHYVQFNSMPKRMRTMVNEVLGWKLRIE